MRIIIQVRELVSSNVTSMIEKASNPVKMLRLLRQEIMESDIALHGEITTLSRAEERAQAAATKAGDDAKAWSDKAKVAMEHGREDLARSALMAREDAKLAGDRHTAEAARLGGEIAEAESALVKLKAKLEETSAQLRLISAADQAAASASAPGAPCTADSKTDRRMDHIANLERRVDFALDDTDLTAATNASLDAEIAGMQREASIDAELTKLRKSTAPKGKKAAKG